MNRIVKLLVGSVALLSLVGVGGAAQAAAAPSSDAGSISAHRWCC